MGTGAAVSTVLISACIIPQLQVRSTPPSRRKFPQQIQFERPIMLDEDYANQADGKRDRTRLCISPDFMDGRCPTVEAGNCFPSMGGMGKRRIWGAAIPFLSAAIVDVGGGA